MRLDNEFEVPRPVDEAWAVLTDLEKIAPCMPGAQLTEVSGDTYHGIVKVKVGPVVAQYAGQARFVEQDAQRHHAVLEAKGKERSGRGIASAMVTADLVGQGATTRVTVSTDLNISGPLAQFGRGALAEVTAKLLGQFVERLRETVLEAGPPVPAPDVAPTPTPAPPPAPAPTPPVPPSAPPAPAAATPFDEAVVTPPRPEPAAAVSPPPEPQPTLADPGQPPAAARKIQGPAAEPADLLAFARGSILKRVIPLVVLVAVIIVVIIWLA